MKKIKLYQTVIFTDAEKLDDQVCDLLESGWELYGNPYSVTEGGHEENCGEFKGYLCQAMTKMVDED